MSNQIGAGFVLRNIHNGKFAVISPGQFPNPANKLNFTRNIDAATIFLQNTPSEFAKANCINVSSIRDCEFVPAKAFRYVSLD